MNSPRSFGRRLRALFRKEKLEREMEEEMRFHLEMEAKAHVAAGRSPDEAHYAALRGFGGVDQIKEASRRQRTIVWLENCLKDLRYAARTLARNPGFTAVIVLSLAFGIGANTAIFSLVDDVILKGLPVRDPGSLVTLEWLPGRHGNHPLSGSESGPGENDTDPATGELTQRGFALRAFEELRGQPGLLSDVFAVGSLPGFVLTIDDLPETPENGRLVSGNYYAALGVTAIRGRTLAAEDDRPGAAPVAVISYDFWRRRFGGEAAAIGKTISINRVPVVIIGVTPPDFIGTWLSWGPADITLPLALASSVRLDGAGLAKPGTWWLSLMGRLQPGATLAQAQASLESAFQHSTRGGISNPDDPPLLRLAPGGRGRTRADLSRNTMLLAPLMGMVGLVLLTACANAANLLLARGAARRPEIAVRLALGASRGRIVRQLLTESVLLSLLGAAVGLLVSRWGLGLLSRLVPPADVAMFDHLTLDGRVLAFTTAVALLTGIGFGLAPSLRATRLNLSEEFQGGVRNLSRGARSPLNKALLMTQVGLAMVLLVAAGLFAQTERNLRAVDLGFNDSHLLLFYLDGAPLGYTKAQFTQLHAGVAERIRAVPGVRSVTFSGWPLATNYGWPGSTTFTVVGQAVRSGRGNEVTWNAVDPNFFAGYQIPPLLGRAIGPADDASAAGVAVINQALARKYFAEENPIGRTIMLQGSRTVIGVVRDIKEMNLRKPTPPTVFIPLAQDPRGQVHYAVRLDGPPAAIIGAIRRAVCEVDAKLPLSNVRTSDEQMRWNLEGERIYANLAVALGGLALGLVCVGLYGLMSYLVLRRTAEIGLRMALGALPGWMLWMILRESLVLVGAGIGLGLLAAFGVTRLISTFLYGLTAADALTYAAVALLLALVAALACMIPALRAARINPVIALRTE